MIDVTDHMMLIMMRHLADTTPIIGDLSLIIAGLTTAYAHTHLYEAMDKLEDEQILYFDTGKC